MTPRKLNTPIVILLLFLFVLTLAGCIPTATPPPPPADTITPVWTETPEPTPLDLVLVQVIRAETFKCVEYYNAKGYPVLDSCEVGWKTEIGEVYHVFTQPVQADGGDLYYEIYRGVDDTVFDPDTFIRKDYTDTYP